MSEDSLPDPGRRVRALAGQVLLIASNLHNGLERTLEAELEPEVREALENAKAEAETLIKAAQRAVAEQPGESP